MLLAGFGLIAAVLPGLPLGMILGAVLSWKRPSSATSVEMLDQTHVIDVAPPSHGLSASTMTRVAIALFGIGMPYLARIPGIYSHRPDWLAQYLNGGPGGLLLISISNAMNWGSILLVTCYFRSASALGIAAAIGFALPVLCHATLDLSADAQSAIAIPMFPIMALPMVGLGWLLGHFINRRANRKGQSQFGSQPYAKCPLCSNAIPDQTTSCPKCGEPSRRRPAFRFHKVVEAVGAVGIVLGVILVIGSFIMREISMGVVGIPCATLGLVIFASGLFLGWLKT